MKTPTSVLVVVHAHSGVGHDPAYLWSLEQTLASHWSGPSSFVVASDHAAVHAAVESALLARSGPLLVIAGGGSGTLRNVVNAVVAAKVPLSARSDVSISALRMGSGNVAARWFGIPKDPTDALIAILSHAREEHMMPCKILRLTSEDAQGNPWTQHATGMLGCGIFGRIPQDVKRIKHHAPWMHRAASAMAGVETINRAEYAGAFATRALRTLLRPRRMERVRVVQRGRAQSFRLVAGAAMTGPIPGMALPHAPDAHGEEAALHLLPLTSGSATSALSGAFDASSMSNVERLTLTPQTPVSVELLDRPTAHLFADEDPFLAHRHYLVELAGTLPFVPGNFPMLEVA